MKLLLRVFVGLAVTFAPVLTMHAEAGAAGKLRVYFIDVEGGQATLFVTPAGKSLLIDTGWPDHNGRDADRIVAAARDAGLKRIDSVLITHFHEDHVGGVPQLVQRIPVGSFFVHGPNREIDHGATEEGYAAFQKVVSQTKTKVIVPKPGDRLPIEGLDVTVVSADGKVIQTPLPGAGEPNAYCKQSEIRPPDQTENARSLGVLIRFGDLKILDLGDLTWDKERDLMCPENRLGKVDVLVVSHHGWNQSSSPALVDAIHPRVAIMDNGAKKGGSIAVLDTVRHAPGIEALWQLHYSDEGGTAHNTQSEYIANLDGPDAGHDIEVTASRNGNFSVRNGRTGTEKDYVAGK
ncbi:MAG TPA: MBL fold metallo-hydrolase [Acidobacteriaceae bacterium]|nr:MBL fold metallo-hydrolase [Acidobacteriaceae bacterium]